jgi:hypothetical protein
LNAPLLQIAVLVASLGCTSAWAEIYKWVDAKGATVYSNIAPAKTSSVKNLEVVVEDQKISEAEAAAAAARREQELLDRISRLERQVQAQQYQPPLYLPAAAAPPPPPYYPPNYYPSTYYPGYFPYAVLPARFVVPSRVHSFHRAGVRRGRR